MNSCAWSSSSIQWSNWTNIDYLNEELLKNKDTMAPQENRYVHKVTAEENAEKWRRNYLGTDTLLGQDIRSLKNGNTWEYNQNHQQDIFI